MRSGTSHALTNVVGEVWHLILAVYSAMSLVPTRRRINAKEVAELLGCSRKTVLNGKGGTSALTRIRNGSQVRFLLEEVLQLMRRQERNKNLSIRDLHSHQINGQSNTSTL